MVELKQIDRAAMVELKKYLFTDRRRPARSDMDGSGQLDELEEHIAKYDTNLDGTFSVAEVKAIVEEVERADEMVDNLKWVIFGVIVLSICGFAAMFGVTIAANEISKDARPEPNGVMMDNDGNIVGTTQEEGSVMYAANRVTTVPTSPDATPLYELNTLADVALVSLTTITVPLAADRNKMYLVQSVEANRINPAAVVVTIKTSTGATITCTNNAATVLESDGTSTDILPPSTAAAAGRRRAMRRRRMNAHEQLDHDDGATMSYDPSTLCCPETALLAFEAEFAMVSPDGSHIDGVGNNTDTSDIDPADFQRRVSDSSGDSISGAEATQAIAT